MDDNKLIRKSLFNVEEFVKDIQKRNIGYYLNKLRNPDD